MGFSTAVSRRHAATNDPVYTLIHNMTEMGVYDSMHPSDRIYRLLHSSLYFLSNVYTYILWHLEIKYTVVYRKHSEFSGQSACRQRELSDYGIPIVRQPHQQRDCTSVWHINTASIYQNGEHGLPRYNRESSHQQCTKQQLLLAYFEDDFFGTIFYIFERLPTLELFSSCVVFCQTYSLECALLRKSKDWIEPLPLHKGVIKRTIRTFIESETKHNRELHTEDFEVLLQRQSNAVVSSNAPIFLMEHPTAATLWYHPTPPSSSWKVPLLHRQHVPDTAITRLKTKSTKCLIMKDLRGTPYPNPSNPYYVNPTLLTVTVLTQPY